MSVTPFLNKPFALSRVLVVAKKPYLEEELEGRERLDFMDMFICDYSIFDLVVVLMDSVAQLSNLDDSGSRSSSHFLLSDFFDSPLSWNNASYFANYI